MKSSADTTKSGEGKNLLKQESQGTVRNRNQQRGQATNRATTMLIVVAITFFIAEFPIAIMLLLW